MTDEEAMIRQAFEDGSYDLDNDLPVYDAALTLLRLLTTARAAALDEAIGVLQERLESGSIDGEETSRCLAVLLALKERR